MKRTLLCASLLASLLIAAQPARAQFEHPDIKSGKRVIRTALLLPPRVTISKAGMKSTEPMIEEGLQVEAALPRIIAGVLEEIGCKAGPNPFTPAAQEENADLKYALGDLQSKYDAISEQMEKKPKDVRKGRFSLGDDVLKVNPGGAETLVFVRGTGYLSTGGKKVFSALVGGPGLYEGIVLSIAVVDGQTGTVLYFARSMTTGNFVKDTESMTKPVRGSFKNLAKAAKGKKA